MALFISTRRDQNRRDVTLLNFQNFDRNFKQLFTSRRRDDGWIIGERDAAQLEFRTAAYFGQDSKAIEDIRSGFDVHSYTADIIGVGRTAAKAHTFKPLFGGTSGTPDERKYYEAFRVKYDGITDTQDRWVQDVLLSKEQVLPTGLRFYWPKVKLTRSGYIEGNTNVRKYPIQNLATAEIIPIGVTFVWHHMKDREMNTLLINTVHDSMITDEDPNETEELNEITEIAFTQEVIQYLDRIYNIQFNVPLEVEAELSTHWGYKPPKFVEK
jgi:DNA polymerase I-like protein with 3'-5' exonuclease and polymerase domains